MKQLKKTILTLVALLAVTTGAWAGETVETTLWEGTYPNDGVEINSTTVSEFNAGDVLRVYVTIPESGANFNIFYKGASNDWTETAIPSVDNQWPWLNGGDTYMDVTFTEADITALTGMGIYIRKGEESTITKVTLITPAAASSATAFEVAWDKAENTGSFTMPGGNVTLEPEYYPQAALTAAPTAINDVPATTDGAIVKAGTVANIGETTTAQGTVMYYVSQTALDDAALLALAADQWKADVPTAKSLTQGEAHVYYYVRGNDSDTDDENFSDGDILAANALTVTIAAEPTYAVTFAEGVNPEPPAEPEWTADPKTGVTKGTPVTVTYTGTKKVIGVKAEKKAAAPALLTLSVCGETIYYAEGETWAEAIQNHPTENKGWEISDGDVNHDNLGFLLLNDDFVHGTAKIDPNASYSNTGM